MNRYRSKISMTIDANSPEEFEAQRKAIEEHFEYEHLNLERLGFTLEESIDGGETWHRAEADPSV